MRNTFIRTGWLVAALGLGACAGNEVVDVAHRAYVVSRDSDDLTIIDLDRLEIVGDVHTRAVGGHMAELDRDFTKAYVTSPGTDEAIVVDVIDQQVSTRIPLGASPTHLSLSRDGSLLAVVDEADDAVSFIDPVTDVEVKRLPGFFTPHFVRWAPDGKRAYVANIGAYHLTSIDVDTLAIAEHIPLDTFQGPPHATLAAGETGFADAQIDANGVLHAAHSRTGRVLTYDTVSRTKLGEVSVGPSPSIVYAEHPFPSIPVSVVPNWGDRSVSVIDRAASVTDVADAGDSESNGVNYSPLVPDKAFVMNRQRKEIAVMDTRAGRVVSRIALDGNTETASTTADGKWIVATVSSANQVVVIDSVTNEIVKTFDNVGRYPWSVTIPRGQNYCH